MTIRGPYFSKFETPTKSPDYQLTLNLDILSKDSTLVGKQIWVVPYGPAPKLQDYQLNLNLVLLSKDARLVGRQRWEVPYGALPKVADWQYKLNPPAFPVIT